LAVLADWKAFAVEAEGFVLDDAAEIRELPAVDSAVVAAAAAKIDSAG
jgi:hypothetical protein